MATDLYTGIHKAIRFALTSFLVEVGASDPGDANRAAALVERFDDLVELLEGHAHHEEAHVHPLIARVAPDVLAKLEKAHGGQEAELQLLRAHFVEATTCAPEARGHHLALAYRGLASFVATYLAHMEDEEVLANPALFRGISEDELMATHMALVGSIEPPKMARYIRIFMPALHVEERVGMLSGMMAAPAPIAELFLGAAKAALAPAQWSEVAERLGLAGRQAAA